MGSMGRPYGLVVGQAGKGTTISSLVDGGHALRRSYGENNVCTDWKKDNYFRAIKEALGNVKGNIGVEFDHMNIQTKRKLEAALPDCKLVDISVATSNQRMVSLKKKLRSQGLVQRLQTS